MYVLGSGELEPRYVSITETKMGLYLVAGPSENTARRLGDRAVDRSSELQIRCWCRASID